MSTEHYDDVLKRVLGLSADDQEKLIGQIGRRAASRKNGNDKTLGECMNERGLCGMAQGPADLSTNPEHFNGFGENGN